MTSRLKGVTGRSFFLLPLWIRVFHSLRPCSNVSQPRLWKDTALPSERSEVLTSEDPSLKCSSESVHHSSGAGGAPSKMFSMKKRVMIFNEKWIEKIRWIQCVERETYQHAKRRNRQLERHWDRWRRSSFFDDKANFSLIEKLQRTLEAICDAKSEDFSWWMTAFYIDSLTCVCEKNQAKERNARSE